MRLVLDENLSIPRLQAALQSRDIPLVLQTELMQRGLPDEEVLAALRGHDDLYLLSRDQDFRYKPAVRLALISHGIGAFVITSAGNKSLVELTELIVVAWPRICKFAATHPRPFVAKVLANGKVALCE